MGRRSISEMKADILKAVELKPINPTRLQGIANLSPTNMKQIILDLEERGFVRIEQAQHKRLVHITDEGRKVLTEYESVIKKLMKVEI